MTSKELILQSLKQGPQSFKWIGHMLDSHGKKNPEGPLYQLLKQGLITSNKSKYLINRIYQLPQ